MSTYREAVYSVLDELKIISDDSLWETDHVVFMLNKYRALLIKQRYGDRKKEIPNQFYQRLNVNFDPNFDTGYLFQSLKKLPYLTDTNGLWISSYAHFDGIKTFNLNFINPKRFKSVGYNKWLKNQIYLTLDLDNYMYIKYPGDSSMYTTFLVDNEGNYLIDESSQFYLVQEILKEEALKYDAILDNPMDIIAFNEMDLEDPLDLEFPVDQSLLQTILDLAIKELGMANQQGRDVANNAFDDSGLQQQKQQRNDS